jgi:hypothetical protein
MDYNSIVICESEALPGVTYAIRKMSFARRLALLRRLRDLAAQAEFRKAADNIGDRTEAMLLEAEIHRTYVEWGVESVAGLVLDGEPATVAGVIERGPEALCREISARVQRECFLNEDERKN